MGLLALTVALAVLAGACAFAIEYEENTHRLERTRARRRALATGAVTTGFFAALGLVLVVALLH